eukprot:323370-Chlamydomonas_euryale.AAC.2
MGVCVSGHGSGRASGHKCAWEWVHMSGCGSGRRSRNGSVRGSGRWSGHASEHGSGHGSEKARRSVFGRCWTREKGVCMCGGTALRDMFTRLPQSV